METKAAPLPSLGLHEDVDRNSINPHGIVENWLHKLQQKISGNVKMDTSDLFIEECWWRDMLALSWNITTKRGRNNIDQYLSVCASKSAFGSFDILSEGALQPRLSDINGLVWIESGFSFENKAGQGRGIVRLANVTASEWKAWIVHTSLDGLRGFPETSPQQKSANEKPTNPQVLIIGAGLHTEYGPKIVSAA